MVAMVRLTAKGTATSDSHMHEEVRVLQAETLAGLPNWLCGVTHSGVAGLNHTQVQASQPLASDRSRACASRVTLMAGFGLFHAHSGLMLAQVKRHAAVVAPVRSDCTGDVKGFTSKQGN